MTIDRSWYRLALTLVLACVLPLAASGTHAKDKKKKKKSDDSAASEKWDVDNPPGEWRTITINTTETTWTNLDVSPDGSTIVFDMLGDLYTVPIAGGEAAALTDGIAWNFQPRYSPDGSRIAFITDRAA